MLRWGIKRQPSLKWFNSSWFDLESFKICRIEGVTVLKSVLYWQTIVKDRLRDSFSLPYNPHTTINFIYIFILSGLHASSFCIYVKKKRHEITCTSWRVWKLLPGMQWAIKFIHSERRQAEMTHFYSSSGGQDINPYIHLRASNPSKNTRAHPFKQMPLFHTRAATVQRFSYSAGIVSLSH